LIAYDLLAPDARASGTQAGLSAALSLIFAVYCDNDETKRRSKSQGLLIKINLTTDSQ
jgi:hypothetical protein